MKCHPPQKNGLLSRSAATSALVRLCVFSFLCKDVSAFNVPLVSPHVPYHGYAPAYRDQGIGSIYPDASGGSVLPLEDRIGRSNQEFRGILPPLHRPLSFLDESQPARGLWLFEQPLRTISSVHMFARMAVYTLADGSVLAYNPIAPTEETLREIEDAFGDPDHIIVPTTACNMVLVKGWAERFPRSTFWGLEGVDLPGAKFKRDLTVDSFPEEWKEELELSILEGSSMFRECFMLHRTTKSVFAIDSLVEMGEANILHPLLRAGSIMAGNFGRPMCPTKALLWDRESCRAAISKVLEWDFETIHAAHGACPIQDAKVAIWNEFQYLWD